MHHSKSLYEKGIIKNRKMLTQSQYPDYKFVCRVNHIKTFHAAIKSICFSDFGTFLISEDGMRITVDQAKSIQATVYMLPSFFEEFYVQDFQSFGIKVNVLAECLSLYGLADCGVKLLYKGEGAPLMILLDPHDDEDLSTECAIKTMNVDEPMEYELDERSSTLNTLFIRGPDLSNIFHELDKAAEEFEFTISPKSPHFKITTLGVIQSESSVEVAKTSDMMLMFNCQATTVARYKCQQIRMTNKSLQVATKVAIKTDSSGLLELHFMLQAENQEDIYVQFYVTPLLDME
ncbi:cell cycle checkpoint protein RAD1 [Drosophila tropicalis]|uniref:cell cycle checkpoint protein RAD1 n=1 Tax=Drosophila tropicalis TaxID=46794 RepID=UPI0035AB9274